MPSKETLEFFRAMPLQLKIRMTQQRIREWHEYCRYRHGGEWEEDLNG